MIKLTIVLLALCFCSLHAERTFFALDNGVASIASVDEQAELLKELGYDGICTRPSMATEEFITACDKHGIAITATYVVLPAGIDKTEVPENIVSHFRMLKGRNTIVWLSLSNAGSPLEPAVELTRKICDVAKENGLTVAFYPHFGCLTAKLATCEKIVKQANRQNLGISFTLCHFLAQNDHSKIESTLRSIAPLLKLVQINGADELPEPGPDWKKIIQPLGKGSLDVSRVIRTLDEIGYSGPVGLQCYNVPGPPREHLKASMDAWKRLNR